MMCLSAGGVAFFWRDMLLAASGCKRYGIPKKRISVAPVPVNNIELDDSSSELLEVSRVNNVSLRGMRLSCTEGMN